MGRGRGLRPGLGGESGGGDHDCRYDGLTDFQPAPFWEARALLWLFCAERSVQEIGEAVTGEDGAAGGYVLAFGDVILARLGSFLDGVGHGSRQLVAFAGPLHGVVVAAFGEFRGGERGDEGVGLT